MDIYSISYSIIIFLAIFWAIGYSITYFVKRPENLIEENLMRLGIGIASYPLIAVLFSIIHIPLDYRLILFLALIVPIQHYIRNYSHEKTKLYHFLKSLKELNFQKIKEKTSEKNIHYILALLIFAIVLFMYVKGSFAYPWLEDTDPYSHAASSSYISIEKTVNYNEPNFFQYLNPYPPGYDATIGLMHQTNDSITWTLKFFNALIVALSVLFFFMFATKFTRSTLKGLFAMLLVAAIPSFHGHFIWAHSLFIMIFFMVMYSFESINDDKLWWIIGAITFASLPLTQPTKTIKVGIMIVIYFIIKWISEKKFNKELFYSLAAGGILALFWWYDKFKAMFAIGSNLPNQTTSSANLWTLITHAFPPTSGTATRPYTFDDFFFATSQNMINNPIGIGWFICILFIISVVIMLIHYKKLLNEDNNWMLISLIWSFYVFMAVNTMTFNLPIGLFAFRFWVLVAICTALVGSQILFITYEKTKSNKPLLYTVFGIIILLIYFTSFVAKYEINTSIWGPAVYNSDEELKYYMQLQTAIPKESKVFSPEAELEIASDMNTCVWCNNEKEFRRVFWDSTDDEILKFMHDNNYQYLSISQRHIITSNNQTKAINKINNEFAKDTRFKPIIQTQSSILFKI